MKLNNYVIVLVVLAILSNLVNGQYSEEEEDDEEYEEEAGGGKASGLEAKTEPPSTRAPSSSSNSTKTGTTVKPDTVAVAAVVTQATAVSATRPTRTPILPVTEDYDYDYGASSRATTRRMDYIYNPVNNILKSVGNGNISGIIDNALSIRTPEPVRDMVNMIISYVFGMGESFGEALTKGVVNVFKPTPASATSSNVQTVAIQPLPLPPVQISLQTRPGYVLGSGNVVTVENLPQEDKVSSSVGTPNKKIRNKNPGPNTSWPKRRVKPRTTLVPLAEHFAQDLNGVEVVPTIKSSKGRRKILRCNATQTEED